MVLVDRFNRLWLNRDISKLKKNLQKEIQELIHEATCPVCHGHRLNEKALASKINGFNIGYYFSMEITDLIPIMQQIEQPVGKALARASLDALNRIVDVGLGYLNLGRSSETLSGGGRTAFKISATFRE